MRKTMIVVLLSLMGCSNQGDPCVSDNDCFRGEACVDGFCGEPILLIEADGGDSDQSPGDVGNGGYVDEGRADDMHATLPDMGEEPGDDMSMTSDGGNNSTTGLCKVDPFTAMCPSDTNDDFADYITMESGRGCLGNDDMFEGGMVTVTDQTICPLESADKFNTNLIPCDTVTFVVEVTVTPKEPCDPDDWDLNVRLQGNDCEIGNGKMRCETLPDGSKRATGFLEPSNSVTSPNIEIRPIAENLQFDYDLTILTRE